MSSIIKEIEEHGVMDIIGSSINITPDGRISEQGWKDLNEILQIYRNKRYETVRYLLIDKQGEIKDHIAVSSYHPSRTRITPIEFNQEEFLQKIKKRCFDYDYKVIIVHNHPSGDITPSLLDKNITIKIQEIFDDKFLSHMILDHGSFSLYTSNKSWCIFTKNELEQDPLLNSYSKKYFGYDMSNGDPLNNLKSLYYLQQIDDGDEWNSSNWVPVFFTNPKGIVTTLNYFPINDFVKENANKYIVDKVKEIGQNTGSFWAFPVTDNEQIYNSIKRITEETAIFRDFYVNGLTGNDLNIGGNIRNSFDLKDTYSSTFDIGISQNQFYSPFQENNNEVASQNKEYSHRENTNLSKEELHKWSANTLVNDSKERIPGPIWTTSEELKNFKEHGIMDVIGSSINITPDGRISERGWKDLNEILSIYSDKRYETARYLFIKNGKIIDHVALSSKIPSSTIITQNDESLQDFYDYAQKTQSKIVFVHNHPSGDINPSDEDIQITQLFEKQFGNVFMGHIILDHGSAALFDSNEQKWAALIEGKIQSLETIDTPFIDKNIIQVQGSMGLLQLADYAQEIDDKATWNTKDWIPTFFTTKNGICHIVHYIERKDFFDKDIEYLSNKFKKIGQSTGTECVYVVINRIDDELFNQIESFAQKTYLIADTFHQTTDGFETSQYSGGRLFDNHSITLESIEDSRIYTFYENKEEKLMDNDTKTMTSESQTLTHNQQKILIEYLNKVCSIESEQDLLLYNEQLSKLDEYAFLPHFLPQNNSTWSDYKQVLSNAFDTELYAYNTMYPYEQIDKKQLPLQIDKNKFSLFDFLDNSQNIKDVDIYETYYNQYFNFTGGFLKETEHKQIALFQDGYQLPLMIENNTSENYQKLYTYAFDNDIAVNNMIPSPEQIKENGIEILTTLYENMNSNKVAETFINNPYIKGVIVPDFGVNEQGNIKILSGYRFDRTEDAGQSIVLRNNNNNGEIDYKIIPSTLYNQIINNAKTLAQTPKLTQEIIDTYRNNLDNDTTVRENKAENFWHNYKILCREQASNRMEAMEVAKAIVTQMPIEEQKKFQKSIKEFDKSSKNQNYNEHIFNYYEQSVKDLPIKNQTIHSTDSLESTKHNVEVIDEGGKTIDKTLSVKIGDVVNLSLEYKDLFGKITILPTKDLVLVASSDELNKVVLLDNTNNSKYTVSKDEFMKHMEKIERKQSWSLESKNLEYISY